MNMMGLDKILENQYVTAVLVLVLVLYGSLARPNIPPILQNLFENPIFRVLLLALIVYRGNQNPQLAIVVAVVFMIVMNLITQQKLFESFQQVENFRGMRIRENMDPGMAADEGNY
jgi:hypothetical protein